jgi:hypothetical protein
MTLRVRVICWTSSESRQSKFTLFSSDPASVSKEYVRTSAALIAAAEIALGSKTQFLSLTPA